MCARCDLVVRPLDPLLLTRATNAHLVPNPPQVKLAQRADGELFAIKCLNRNRLELAVQSGRLAKEIKLLRLLNHPNVIRLHEVLHTPNEILMVMEYVDGGDLLEVLNQRVRFSENEVRGRAARLKEASHPTPPRL